MTDKRLRMGIISITVEPAKGLTIQEAAEFAHRAGSELGVPVSFVHNGITYDVDLVFKPRRTDNQA